MTKRQHEERQATRGLLLVFTGSGKGKTTAAMGLAMRAMGHGQRVCVIQFIKGGWQTGEQVAGKRFADLLDFHVMGRGFTWKSDDLEEDIAMARKGWELAARTIRENRHRLVILDELTYPLKYNMLAVNEVVRILVDRPAAMHVVVTGRDAPEPLLEAADLITEMREIRHPYSRGIKAQQGIEF